MPRQHSMMFRKWIIRGCSLVGMIGIFALLGGFLTWTSPAFIRNLLLERVRDSLVDTRVHLDSLQVNLWGGITAQGLRLARNGPFDSPDFLYIPKAQIVHDKEAILEGRLAIREVNLVQPRLRIIRQPNGAFNIDGLFKKPSADGYQLPAWSVSQGQVIFEDRLAALEGTHWPNLEIRELRGKGLQDASEKVWFEARGHGDWLGPILIEGNKPGKKSPLTLDLRMEAIALKAGLSQVIQHLDPAAANWLRHLSGTVQAEMRAEIPPDPVSPIPRPKSLLVSLRDGSWQLPLGAIRVDHLEGELEGNAQGIQRMEVRGEWKSAKIKANLGAWDLPLDQANGKWTSPGMPGTITAEVRGVEFSRELFSSFPQGAQGVQDFFQPRGKADVFIRMVKKEGAATESSSQSTDFDLEVRPLGMSFLPKSFPYPILNATGIIICQIRGGELRGVDSEVFGFTQGGTPLHVKAKGRGRNGHEDLEVFVDAQNAPIDDTLRAALAKPQQELFDQFRPTGFIDVNAHVTRRPGNEKLENDIDIQFRQATTIYRGFPYLIEHISGLLKIEKGNWYCSKLEGVHGTGKVFVDGRSWQAGEISKDSSPTMRLLIRGEQLPANGDLRAALDLPLAGKKKSLAHTWDELNPSETITFETDLVHRQDSPDGMELSMTVHDATLTPRLIPYRLSQVKGLCHMQGMIANLSQVSARHDRSRIGMKAAQVRVQPNGEVKLRFEELAADPLMVDTEMVKALPAPLKRGLSGVKIDGDIGVKCDLSLSFPEDERKTVQSEWNGRVQFRNNRIESGLVFEKVKGEGYVAGKHNGQNWDGVNGNLQFDQMTLFGQHLKNAHGRFEVQPETPSTLRLQDIHAQMHGGEIGGHARIDFAATTRYDLLFGATQVRLEEFSKANFGDSAQMEGQATAMLHLQGIGTDVNGLFGEGSIDVPQGKLYKLPPLLDLIKTLGLRVPDGTAFEQVHAQFGVDGPMLRFRQLDLYGNAITLCGKGTVPLDGRDMALEFRTEWARVNQFLPQVIEKVPKAISEQLFLVRIHGNPRSPKIERDVLPGLTQPFRNAFKPNLSAVTGGRAGGP